MNALIIYFVRYTQRLHPGMVDFMYSLKESYIAEVLASRACVFSLLALPEKKRDSMFF